MVKRILVAERRGRDYFIRVHLDDTKVLGDGTPDPRYVHEWTWGPPGATGDALGIQKPIREADYLQSIRAQLADMAEAQLQAMAPAAGVKLAMEGQALP